MSDRAAVQEPSVPATASDPYDLGEAEGSSGLARDPETGRFVSASPTTEPAAGSAPSPEPAAPPPAPTHSSYLLQQARELGISDEEIADLPTDQALGRAVNVARRALAQQFQRIAQSAQQAGNGARPPSPAPAPETDDLDLGEMAKDLDPNFAAYLHKLAHGVRSSQAEARQLKQTLLEERQHRYQEQQVEHYALIENAFRRLASKDAHWKSIFSDQPAGQLNPQQPEMLRRNSALSLAGMLAGQAGLNRHNLDDLLERAALVNWPRAAAAPAPTPAPVNGNGTAPRSPSAAEWQEAGLARPTQRGGAAEPDGPEKARRNLERALGRPVTPPGGDDLSGLPD